VAIAGNVNVFESQTQEGSFDPIVANLAEIGKTKNNPPLSYGVVKKLLFTGDEPSVTSITAGVIGKLVVEHSLRFPTFGGHGDNGVDLVQGVHRWQVNARFTRLSSNSRPSK